MQRQSTPSEPRPSLETTQVFSESRYAMSESVLLDIETYFRHWRAEQSAFFVLQALLYRTGRAKRM